MADEDIYEVVEDTGPDDLLVEADWAVVASDDEAWAGPTSLAPPPAAPGPPDLNTHEMEWEDFERLILHIAREHDGAYEARRYGKRGQRQYGLDAVAFFSERRPTVYQAKGWLEFGARDLEAAVERYAAGRRPFNADRIVVAVKSDVDDTETIEKLSELRERYAPLTIELWDRGELSAILAKEYRIVIRFWGQAIAAIFCVGSEPLPPSVEGPSIAADAVLRGPIAHLGLAEEVRQAEQMLKEHPGDAALIFRRVAERLELCGYAPHGALIREQEARAFRAAGQRVDEAWTRISLGWIQVKSGNSISARAQLHQLRDAGDLPPEVRRCMNALNAAVAYVMDHAVTLEQLAPVINALEIGDRHHVEAVLLFVEEAVANRLSVLVESRVALIERVASSLPQDNEGLLESARLRCCIADSIGDWSHLIATARETYPPSVTALITARYARFLTLEPNPVAADARWSDAIERACMQGLNDDAADWLYSQRAMRIENGILVGWDLNEAHRHAQALRAAGSGSVIPEPFSARERGLDYMREEDWPQAVEALQRYLCRSVVAADWRGELDAHGLLGDVFRSTRRPVEAFPHYIASGNAKRLENLIEIFGEERIHLPIDLLTPRHSERNAAFTFAAAAADLLVDEDTAEWCARAFVEFQEHSYVAGFGSPNPWLAALNAFARLASASSEVDAFRFLEIGKELIPRAANTYKFTDEAQVLALIAIARSHPGLRDEAFGQLLDALLADQQMAEKTILHGQDLLRENSDRVAAHLRDAARDNLFAALALIVAGADTAPCEPLARQFLEGATAPRVITPGVMAFGTGLPRTAYLITVLPEQERITFARAMVTLAQDERDATLNRCEALRAIRTVGRYLPEVARSELFEAVMPFASREGHGEPSDRLFSGFDDLLQRYRISFGSESIEAAGLLAAAALSCSPDHYRRVERVGLRLFYGADDITLNTIAQALSMIPVEQLSLPAELLASQSNQWLRALAAVVWAQRRSEAEAIGLQLAKDASQHVRRSLAQALNEDDRHRAVRAVLLGDARRSIRSIVERPHP